MQYSTIQKMERDDWQEYIQGHVSYSGSIFPEIEAKHLLQDIIFLHFDLTVSAEKARLCL